MHKLFFYRGEAFVAKRIQWDNDDHLIHKPGQEII